MTVTYIGNLTLGGAMPGAASVAIAGAAGINAALPDIQARLTALAAFSPQPISFAANLAVAQGIVASIQSAIAFGITPPDISAQISIVLAQVAALTSQVLAINAQLGICTDFSGLLGVAGVHLYSYAGDAGDFGGEFTAEWSTGLPGGAGAGENINAVVLATGVSAAFTAMQGVFAI